MEIAGHLWQFLTKNKTLRLRNPPPALHQLRCSSTGSASEKKFDDLDDIEHDALPVSFHTLCL